MGSDGRAYWYKQKKLIKVQNDLHIKDICDHPETFGYTKEELEDIFKKYNEKWGTEGKAREEIMVKAMKDGWIRVRESSSQGKVQWMIQYDNFEKRKKDLQELISILAIDKEIIGKYSKVIMMDTNGTVNREYFSDYNFMQGTIKGKSGESVYAFLEEALKKKGSSGVQIVESYSYFNY